MEAPPDGALALLPRPECVHCGFCLPACPTYAVLGNEADSPRGRLTLMQAVDEGRLPLSEGLVRHLDLCLLCRACETACPSGVPFSQHMQRHREQLVGSPLRPAGQRLAERLLTLAVALPAPVQRLGIAALRLAERAGLGGRLAETAAGRGPRGLAAALLLSNPPDGVELPVITPAVGRRRLRVALLTGCVARWLFGRVNAATVRLLARAGCEVVVPPSQGCCGALHVHGGRTAGARRLARANLKAFAEVGQIDHIVVNAAGCGSTLKEYGALFAAAGSAAGRRQGRLAARDAARAADFAARTRDALELLDELGLPEPRRPVERRVAYHDACHLAHGQGVRSGPRRLLAQVPGLELLPLPEADRCCGSAGIYNLLHPHEARLVLAPKLERLAASGAQVVAAANPGCLMQLAAGLKGAGLAMEARHPLELLDEACR